MHLLIDFANNITSAASGRLCPQNSLTPILDPPGSTGLGPRHRGEFKDNWMYRQIGLTFA